MIEAPLTLEQALRIRLGETRGTVLYPDLRAHLERDAVFVVSDAVDLIDAAVAVAMDDVATVGRWIESSELRKPTADERDHWCVAVGRRWQAIVVQPFVLVQDRDG
jgi:hypothetical protein